MKSTFSITIILILAILISGCSREEHAVIETSMGTIVIDLFEEQAPLHSANFADSLIVEQALIGTYFHRVIPGFVVQGGDPNTLNPNRMDDGMGGVREDRIPEEIGLPHLRGAVGAARDNNEKKASSSSQFYICLDRLAQLDAGYTVFGQVVAGMDVVDAVARLETDDRDNPLKSVYIEAMYMDKARKYK